MNKLVTEHAMLNKHIKPLPSPFEGETYSEFCHRAITLDPYRWQFDENVVTRPVKNKLRPILSETQSKNNYLSVTSLLAPELHAFSSYLPWLKLCEAEFRGDLVFPKRKLRMCMMCQSIDIERNGHAFLKPEHQLPMATICTVHSSELINVISPDEIRSSVEYADLVISTTLNTYHSVRLDLSVASTRRRSKTPVSYVSMLVNQLLCPDRDLAKSASEKLGWGKDVDQARERFFGILYLLTRPGRMGNTSAANAFWHQNHDRSATTAPISYPSADIECVAEYSMNILLDIAGCLSSSPNIELGQRLKRWKAKRIALTRRTMRSDQSNWHPSRLHFLALEMLSIDASPSFDAVSKDFPSLFDEWQDAWRKAMVEF